MGTTTNKPRHEQAQPVRLIRVEHDAQARETHQAPTGEPAWLTQDRLANLISPSGRLIRKSTAKPASTDGYTPHPSDIVEIAFMPEVEPDDAQSPIGQNMPRLVVHGGYHNPRLTLTTEYETRVWNHDPNRGWYQWEASQILRTVAEAHKRARAEQAQEKRAQREYRAWQKRQESEHNELTLGA